MIYNSRFVWQKTGGRADWRIQNPQAGDGTCQDSEKGSCLKLSGNPNLEQYAIQGVYTAGEEGDVYS